MPELPEVETVARGLRERCLGKTLSHWEVRYPGLFRDAGGKRPEAAQRAALLALFQNRTIREIRRRGKYILMEFSGPLLVVHLRMTGKFSMKEEDLKSPHTHLVLHFTDGTFLLYNDIRKFGTFQLLANVAELEGTTTGRLGPEPLDAGFTLEVLEEALRGSRQQIKAFLLNQSRIAGIGNIYADEILFQAGILPDRPADTLEAEERKALYCAIGEKLLLGITSGGASIRNYVNESGETGKFQELLAVYGRKGSPCPCCGEALQSHVVAGRTSTFCTHCQK